MTRPQPDMIVSGVPYEVTTVDGQAPVALSDFAGAVTMTTHGPTGDHEVSGSGGAERDGTVRVHEKDHAGTGKDVRVWTVSSEADDDGFVAEG